MITTTAVPSTRTTIAQIMPDKAPARHDLTSDSDCQNPSQMQHAIQHPVFFSNLSRLFLTCCSYHRFWQGIPLIHTRAELLFRGGWFRQEWRGRAQALPHQTYPIFLNSLDLVHYFFKRGHFPFQKNWITVKKFRRLPIPGGLTTPLFNNMGKNAIDWRNPASAER